MKKLFTFLVILSILHLASYGQSGMNISGSLVKVQANTYLIMGGDLKISNTNGLTIKPNAFVTTKGELNLNNAPEALVVESFDGGTGSYIVDGDVIPTGIGTARIQTFILGTVGDYFLHLVGPTVEDPTPGYNNAVRLQQFDMALLNTYAYEWHSDLDESDAWVNVWPYDHPVAVGDGLALTNNEAYTFDWLNMIGYPISENITYSVNYNANNIYELISNPYTCTLDFETFAASTPNDDLIYNRWWIYSGNGDDVPGNWVHWSSTLGTPGYLQVGQACFVEVQAGATGSLNFNNSYKEHSNVDFRETVPNILRLDASGGGQGFKDVLHICFREDATVNYDIEIESEKWYSMSADATMIRSIAEDGTELAINCLPLTDLNTTLTTVPVHFECGEEAEYTFTFSGIDSFDWGTEVWLEDVQAGDNWISIASEEFEYHFTANPEDDKERFFIHFFGPTYVPEDEAINENGNIKIYAADNYAYVLNNSQEIIKHISIHNLMGQKIYEGKLPQQTLNKIYVSGQTGYYVVRVETDKNIYAEKVLILK